MLAASKQLISMVYLVTGKLGEATLFAEESLRLSREAHIPLLEAYNLFWLAIAKSWQGEFNSALELSAKAKALAKAHNLQMVLLVEWIDCLSQGGEGRYDDALATLMAKLELSTRFGDQIMKCRMLNSLGWIYAELYNLEPAIRYNQEGLDASQKAGDPEIIRNAEINLGDCYLLQGDLERAQTILEKVYRDSQQRGKWGEEWMKWRYMQHCCHSLGELRLKQGDAQKAIDLAEECLRLAEPTVSRKNLVKGWRLKGQAFLAQGKIEEAESFLKKGLAIAEEIGNPPQLWKTYAALGQLHERKGEVEQARSAYVSAVRVIDETAGRLQDQAIKQTFLSAQPIQNLRQGLERFGGTSAAQTVPS